MSFSFRQDGCSGNIYFAHWMTQTQDLLKSKSVLWNNKNPKNKAHQGNANLKFHDRFSFSFFVSQAIKNTIKRKLFSSFQLFSIKQQNEMQQIECWHKIKLVSFLKVSRNGNNWWHWWWFCVWWAGGVYTCECKLRCRQSRYAIHVKYHISFTFTYIVIHAGPKEKIRNYPEIKDKNKNSQN